jgi:hypothetical protein
MLVKSFLTPLKLGLVQPNGQFGLNENLSGLARNKHSPAVIKRISLFSSSLGLSQREFNAQREIDTALP